MESQRDGRVHPAWWALITSLVLVATILLSVLLFQRRLTPHVNVTLTADRAGLVMEPGAKVKLRGVQVGTVGDVQNIGNTAELALEINPDQAQYIPSNVVAEIRATTAFGAKFVDLVYPMQPAVQRLAAGDVIQSRNVSTEVNTVFENLVGVLDRIDPAKINAVLAAFAEAFRGQGQPLGQAITDANQVLLELNPRAETVRRDWRSLQGASDTYSEAAGDILQALEAASTTSATITANASQLDALLLNVTGFADSGINLLAASKDNLIRGVNDLEPTTALLLKYNPELTCTLVGAHTLITDFRLAEVMGGNGRAGIASGAFSLGDDPYTYPENLPIIGAKGGPDGEPGCGSLPDVSKNFPVRALITNTGWGTGLDYRPNPGIGNPCYANYLPATRAVPEPPSVRQCLPGPAPGPPPPYPGGPPYGAPWYAPDGTPLYLGRPPGVPSVSPPPNPSHPLPGTEPFAPPVPARSVPTPLPPRP